MKKNKKVIYYNMSGDLDYENQLLQEWNIDDLELIQVTGNNFIEDVKEAESLTLEYTQVDCNALKNLPNLKIIALQSIGSDEIDIECADREGIYVTNAPGFCAYEVASHVMALILDLNRQISVYAQAVKAGDWAPFSGHKIERLRGKTVGLVSLGSIPQALIPMLKGFGLNVVFYSPNKTDQDAARLGITRCDSLTGLLNISDIVSLHTPLLASTKHMMNEQTFLQMKDGAMIINTARGELIDESVLITCLKLNKISAAGLDVLANEHKHDSELIGMENVIVTPHVGFLSKQSLLDCRKIALEQIVMALSKGIKPRTALNKSMLIIR